MNSRASLSVLALFSRRFLPFATAAILCGLLSSLAVKAQPSGGPYGPVQQRYELPKTKRIYYVAPDGKAELPGSTLKDPTTLENAIARAETGNAIILRGGVYRTGGLKLNQGVTIQPYEDERPIIKGTEIAADWKSQANGVWSTTWKKFFPADPADWWNRRSVKQTPLYLFNNDMLFVDGELYATVGSLQDVKDKTYYIDYEEGVIYLGTNPENHLVEITAHDSALVRTTRDVHGKKNDRQGPILRGLTFTQYAGRALEVEGTEPGKYMSPDLFGKEVVGTTFENLTISFCSRVAGYFRGDKLTIRNCLVSDCGTEGLYVVDSSDVLLEKNVITRTNNAEKITGYFASAVKIFNQTYRVTFRDNLVIDNPNSSGVWYDVGNVDGVFVNNWIERTNDGLFFEISKGVICAGNVFYNVNNGIRILNSSGAQVYQNTFYNSTAFFDRTERSAVDDHFGWHSSSGPAVEERHGHSFVNNLLVADENFRGPLLRFHQSATVRERLREPHVKALDGNVYVRRAGAKSLPLIVWSPAQNEKDTQDILALAELRKIHPEFEARSQDFPDYWGPLFRGVELGNLELLKAFPGSKIGVPLPPAVNAALKWRSGTFPGAYTPRSLD